MAFALLRSLGNLLPTRRGPSVRVEKQLTLVEKQRQILEEHRNSTPTGRLKTAFGKGLISQFWFLPYHDQLIGETPAMRAAYRLMLRSSTVKTGLYSKILSVASLDYQIQPDIPDSPRDLEACEFLKYNISRTPMGMFGLVHTILTHKLINGHQLSEPVLDMEREDRTWRGKVVLADLKAKHPDTYDLQCDEYSNPAAVKGRGPNAGDVWPISDFVYSRYLPLYDDPLGTSDLRAAYQPYFMRDTVTKLRAIHAEKYTSPFMVGQYGNQDDKPDLEDALARARSNSWIAIPVGTQIEAKSIATSGESDYKSFIDDCDKQMLIGIVGAYLQILEGQVQDGRGSASVSKTVSELFQWLLAVIFQEVINKQLFPLLMRLNYAGIGVPRLTLGGVSEDEIAKIIANMQGAQALGLKLSQKDAYTRLSMQPPLGPDDELTAATVTQLQTQAMQAPAQGDPGFGGMAFSEDSHGTFDQFGVKWVPIVMANGKPGWKSENGLIRAKKPRTEEGFVKRNIGRPLRGLWMTYGYTNINTQLARSGHSLFWKGQALPSSEAQALVDAAKAGGASQEQVRALERLHPANVNQRIRQARIAAAGIRDPKRKRKVLFRGLRKALAGNGDPALMQSALEAAKKGGATNRVLRHAKDATTPQTRTDRFKREWRTIEHVVLETRWRKRNERKYGKAIANALLGVHQTIRQLLNKTGLGIAISLATFGTVTAGSVSRFLVDKALEAYEGSKKLGKQLARGTIHFSEEDIDQQKIGEMVEDLKQMIRESSIIEHLPLDLFTDADLKRLLIAVTEKDNAGSEVVS